MKKLIWAWGIYLLLSLLASLSQAETPWGWDFYSYEHAAESVYHSQPIYVETPYEPYLYPPFLAILIVPIAIPFSSAITATIWFCLNILLTISMVYLLTTPHSPTFIWATPLLFTPMFLTLFLGQVSILMAALLVGVWWLTFSKTHSYTAGFCLAVAIWIKLYPAIFLPYLLVKREWKVGLSTIVCCLALGIFQVIFAGWDNFEDYFTRILPNLTEQGRPDLISHNLSIYGVATRLFSDTPDTVPLIESSALFFVFRFGIILLLILSLGYILLKPRPNQHKFEFSLIMMFAPLLGSVLWLHGYIAWLMPIIVVWMTAQTHQQALKRLCMVAYLMITLHLPIIIAVDVLDWQNSPLTQIITSLPFFATLLLWGMIVRLISWHPKNFAL